MRSLSFAALVLSGLLPGSYLRLAAQINVLTSHNDVARTGANLMETTLTLANVKSSTFGKLFQKTLDGMVDAQPLYVSGVAVQNQGTHNVLIVGTENDSLYALDADTGSQLWKLSLLRSGETPSDDRGCSQVTPQIGITSTPVIAFEPGTTQAAVFAVAMSKDAAGNYHQRLHKVNLATGQNVMTAVDIAGKYPGTGEGSSQGFVSFDPKQYKERAGLLLLNGVVYLAWASHCDFDPYTGWIMGYSAKKLAPVYMLNVTPNGAEGAIWQAGGGLAADASGSLYFLDATGTFDPTLNAQGFPSSGDFGNAFIRLSTAGGKLNVADYFTMDNTTSESNGDVDLGSGSALVLPAMLDVNGKGQYLAIGAGKDGNIYVVNRANMGKFNSQNDTAVYEQLNGVLPGGIWSMPAYFNGQVYFGAVGGPIRAFRFNNAVLSATPASMTGTSFSYPGATPSISANGSTNGILWAVENNSTAVLHAFSAVNLATELYNSSQAMGGRDDFGSGNKFMVPTIANGKVYVGTPNGVAAFGLLP